MRRSGRIGRIVTAAAVGFAGIALAAPSANGAFHLMVIREVHTGPPGDFVELQMYAAGQNFVAGHAIQTYDNAGLPIGSPFVFPGNATNGGNQRTILVGDAAVSPDFPSGLNVAAGAGAVCFENPPIDCVSYGGVGGSFPSPTGTPAPALADGESLERSIAPNCPTLLEAGDDTNNSAMDFALAAPSPRSNATSPTETACTGGNPGGGPDTMIDKGPKKKTKKKKAKFKFSSPTPGVSFECSVDGNAPKAFGACTSPFTVRVKKGKHKFEVRAVLDGVPDGSPATHNWKVKKKKKKK